MRHGNVHVLLLIAAALSVPGPASACGDKLAAVAGGLRYERLQRAKHPARLALFVPASSVLASSGDASRIAADLERAGHSVEIVDSRSALQARLDAGSIDLVVVGPDVPAPTGVGPVLRVGSSADARSREPAQPCLTVVSRRSARALLRSVDDAMDGGRTRGAAQCAVAKPIRGI